MSKKRILIVDDDPHIVMMTKSRLEANGFETLTASNGLEAIKAAKEAKPHLILLDVIMPALSGYDVCLKLKAQEETANIPIIVFTVSSRKDLEAMCLKAGAKAVILKPFRPSELLGLIRKALDSTSKWRKPESIL